MIVDTLSRLPMRRLARRPVGRCTCRGILHQTSCGAMVRMRYASRRARTSNPHAHAHAVMHREVRVPSCAGPHEPMLLMGHQAAFVAILVTYSYSSRTAHALGLRPSILPSDAPMLDLRRRGDVSDLASDVACLAVPSAMPWPRPLSLSSGPSSVPRRMTHRIGVAEGSPVQSAAAATVRN